MANHNPKAYRHFLSFDQSDVAYIYKLQNVCIYMHTYISLLKNNGLFSKAKDCCAMYTYVFLGPL